MGSLEAAREASGKFLGAWEVTGGERWTAGGADHARPQRTADEGLRVCQWDL